MNRKLPFYLLLGGRLVKIEALFAGLCVTVALIAEKEDLPAPRSRCRKASLSKKQPLAGRRKCALANKDPLKL